ncbi:HpcH/HpaI aldolase/citrate lyase family protein [Azospirillum rugosum]|uniref:Citrate lyase subunit beta/citryl-CoA lyase n=1 Tax=Azospirillum rugosum TaxID=416170 RepID=A0ABS4SM46_9PROT|nr:CoA ester lyase [Azospirillum rugosum]MBP2293638.1 citrate lyase subunit beta/citryl-CoA lyase [Azospirillum rugosum]MDQ0527183.1 citrate lyase subunit beta/citryl-CoA lyase [Azospirillum rugosum]
MTVLRSLLFAPGNHPRRVEKAFTLGADAVILDLEDACAVAEKAATRPVVVEALRRLRPCLGYVRVNALSTDFAYEDLRAVVQAGVDGIVLPKVERPDDLRTADWLVGQLERERGLPVGSTDIIPILESGAGFSALDAIARSGTRVRRFAFGAGDFTLDMGLTWTRDELELLHHRSAIVLASRAAGLEPPIDTVWIDLKDADGFRDSSVRARTLGFQGKLCIHPDQVPAVNDAFTPTDAEVRKARRVIDAFAEAEAKGSSSFQIDGQFVDYPILYQAQRVLSTLDAIDARRTARL